MQVRTSSATRLAPSPTGALHLGNARTFVVNWLLARQRGWRIILRMDDIDGPRVKPAADLLAINDLSWLGLDWDEGPIYQSGRTNLYSDATAALVRRGSAYFCVCTRKEVELAASAPHAEDGAAVYPGTCRGRYGDASQALAASGRAPAIRFAVGHDTLKVDDQFAGNVVYDVEKRLGDFVIAKADGAPAYQLASVVDDAAMGITHVVRGDDLLDSTPRQILLYRALGLESAIPEFWHLPLVIGADGRRLAKRHGDTRLSYYRERGVSSGRMLALLARWMGIDGVADEIDLRELQRRFTIDAMPRAPIVFCAADDDWLLGARRAQD